MPNMLDRMSLAVVTIALAVASPLARADNMHGSVTREAVRDATTPDQHRELADGYARDAEAMMALAHEHQQTCDLYRNGAEYQVRKLTLRQHCTALVNSYVEASRALDALSNVHRSLADRPVKPQR